MATIIDEKTGVLDLDKTIAQRNLLLKEHQIDPKIIQKAWSITAHLLLKDGSHIVNMGCRTGELTFTMAALHPHLHFTGLDKNKRKITQANTRFELDNLDFKIGDVTSSVFGKESIDAIIDSHILHEIYSGSRYDEQTVSETLIHHHKMLKKGGQLFIRDYARPPPGEFILMELPDLPSKSSSISDLSDADLLVWYAQHARPKHDPGCGGFFIEELPPHFPKTRLFRLPHKWAYEFIMRKDDRAHWESELPVEYTFFTNREMRKSLQALGMRLQYASPYWDEDIIKERFEGKFRLYQEDGTPMDYPAVSYITLSTKMADRKSLEVSERRPSTPKENSSIQIKTLRNEKTGALIDTVKRTTDYSEIIPYRIARSGRLKVFLHSGLVRSIANAVPRKGIMLGDQRWSGHMIEPISVESENIPETLIDNAKETEIFSQNFLGVKPYNKSNLITGPDYYPAPDYIDERIQTYYLQAEAPKSGQIKPKTSPFNASRFQEKGEILEFDAQQILDAISVGLIPNAKLEMQILSLFNYLKIKPENWTQKDVAFKRIEIMNKTSLRKAIMNLDIGDTGFIDSKGSANQLRKIHSIFVEEGRTKGATTGLSYEEIDFVCHNSETNNIAVVLPLTKDQKSMVHAAGQFAHLPIPKRHEGSSLSLSAPRFELPADITNLRLAKKFIANKFGVTPDCVIKMGEPYFTHLGLTPQKIHPFAVLAPHGMLDDPINVFLPFHQMSLLRKSISKDIHLMVLLGRAYRFLNDELKLDAKASAKYMATKSFDVQTPSFSIPLDYYRAPSLPEEKKKHPIAALEDLQKTNKVTTAKAVQLKEDLPPSFDQANIPDTAEEKHTTAEKVKALIQPLLGKKKDPTINPADVLEDHDDFEDDLLHFIEDLNALEHQNSPKPEKW